MSSYAESGDAAALKAHAQKTAPIVQRHFEHAQQGCGWHKASARRRVRNGLEIVSQLGHLGKLSLTTASLRDLTSPTLI